VKSETRSPKPEVRRALVCFALKEEAQAISWKVWGDWGKGLITGIGNSNAEKSVREFLAANAPRMIFTCGFAGGLNPELAIGDVIFETQDAALGETLAAAGARPGKFFCATRVATTVLEKAELRRTTGADAVEMESEIIHAISRERGIPCATVRAISDTADEDLPLDFNQLSEPDQSLHYGKLALAIARAPGRIPGLLRLQKHASFAARRLAEVLTKVVGPR